MIPVLKKIPQLLTENPRKTGLQLVLLLCWAIILVGTFTLIS